MAYGDKQTHLKGTFLIALAIVLSRHLNFWNGHKLMIDPKLAKRLATFPIHDPEVRALASSCSGGGTQTLLVQMLVDHMNKHMRVGKLRVREERKKGSSAKKAVEEEEE